MSIKKTTKELKNISFHKKMKEAARENDAYHSMTDEDYYEIIKGKTQLDIFKIFLPKEPDYLSMSEDEYNYREEEIRNYLEKISFIDYDKAKKIVKGKDQKIGDVLIPFYFKVLLDKFFKVEDNYILFKEYIKDNKDKLKKETYFKAIVQNNLIVGYTKEMKVC